MKHYHSNISYKQKPEINLGDFIDDFIVLAKDNHRLYLDNDQRYAIVVKEIISLRFKTITGYSIKIFDIYNREIK